ncbi:hypothetical protein [Parabacteroides distasonis]|uniref:hypothetical protein n=1 Tax=Parabacteroides distasonis TaxID=823 RepID=UPI00189E637E|nr:hypothetical protein [Parabacteroides distasonis]MDB9152120.1 hypothetical protein [Parabacteroides distasonis]MDB9156675.1 hypothetical protein [Parabacteroides distasonis]MDB9165801.1 hypothetical protein [Parabacteroides distasonis]MDB9170208.1 hypothetical protein [Parabacteroides distasonis]MDB9194703.1 hypothetical protein [Parabacteroides distasonis]
MEAKLFGLTIIFESVETESFYVEFSSYPDCASFLVRKILSYYDSKLIRSFDLSPIKRLTPLYSLMNPSYADLFNFLIH